MNPQSSMILYPQVNERPVKGIPETRNINSKNVYMGVNSEALFTKARNPIAKQKFNSVGKRGS
jgi:hypothetical protein